MNIIFEVACIIYNCTINDIMGSSRKRNIVNARYLIYALALENGYNPLHISPMMNRGRCMTYHFLKMVRALKKNDNKFIKALNNANTILSLHKQ